ncbi:hypothetical protein SAMN05444266_107425 [Chitinophaga jiangningensis]|uniref:Uncharacterized protein n=1 Tax=Chitinophaga jiangningensis TaxID=1419482 RepID=A0A1M7HXZ4_9BACT|nr:hypothetical protein [Chitinophaga jiangningensis]SHM33278.1 hypothetical protein SAMN05444266_107425 [Chitinophaga jiangningensis]
MLKTFISAAMLIMALSCQNTPQQHTEDMDSTVATSPDPITQLDVKPLSGFFVKNTVTITDSLTFWVIDNQQTFDSLFGMARTMADNVVAPDFGTSVVIAATMPPTYYGTQLSLDSATLNTNTNNAALHFSAAANAEKGSAAIVPLWLGSIPKTGKTAIRLYSGNDLAKTVTEQE